MRCLLLLYFATTLSYAHNLGNIEISADIQEEGCSKPKESIVSINHLSIGYLFHVNSLHDTLQFIGAKRFYKNWIFQC